MEGLGKEDTLDHQTEYSTLPLRSHPVRNLGGRKSVFPEGIPRVVDVQRLLTVRVPPSSLMIITFNTVKRVLSQFFNVSESIRWGGRMKFTYIT